MSLTCVHPAVLLSQKPRNLVLVEIDTSTGKQLIWVVIDLDACVRCGVCRDVCNFDAVKVI